MVAFSDEHDHHAVKDPALHYDILWHSRQVYCDVVMDNSADPCHSTSPNRMQNAIDSHVELDKSGSSGGTDTMNVAGFDASMVNNPVNTIQTNNDVTDFSNLEDATDAPFLRYLSRCAENQEGYNNFHCDIANTILTSAEFGSYIGARVVKVESVDEADFQIIRCTDSSWESEYLCTYDDDVPTIVLEHLDGASVTYPDVLQKKQTIGYFKHIRYHNFAARQTTDPGAWSWGLQLLETNKNHPESSVPLAIGDLPVYIDNEAGHPEVTFIEIADQTDDNGVTWQSKIKFMPFWQTFGLGDSLSPFLELRASNSIDPHKPMQNRIIDVFFAGNLHVGEEPVYTHRNQAVLRMNDLKQKFDSDSNRPYNVVVVTEPMQFSTYMEHMCDAKLFVSPWGHGEWSLKDEEASWCHSIVIKPGVSWLTTGPVPIYAQVAGDELELKLDFSNLEDVVVALLQAPDELQRRSWRKTFFSSMFEFWQRVCVIFFYS